MDCSQRFTNTSSLSRCSKRVFAASATTLLTLRWGMRLRSAFSVISHVPLIVRQLIKVGAVKAGAHGAAADTARAINVGDRACFLEVHWFPPSMGRSPRPWSYFALIPERFQLPENAQLNFADSSSLS